MTFARPARWAGFAFGFAAFAVPAALYVASASWEPGSWDTAELQGTPYILGITHPTGFPLYVLLGYAWSHLFAIGTIAWRMNVAGGLSMAVVALAAYLTARLFGASRTIALLATLWFACTQNVWAHGARAEAQTLAAACSAVAIYAILRWLRGASDRWFVAAFALCGLGMAAHPNALWLLPALGVAWAIARRRPSRRSALAAFAAAAGALLLYLYLPLRSAYVVAHGLDPASVLPGAGGGIFWNYNDPSTLAGFAREVTGTESQAPSYFLASFNPMHVQDALWTFVTTCASQYGTFAFVLMAAGAVAAWRRDWRATLVLVAACTAGLLFSAVYPNEGDVGRYRLLASWIAVPLFGALAPDRSRGGLALAAYVALALALATGTYSAFTHQRAFFRRMPGEGGRWVIEAVDPYVPRGSVIVTGWLDATSLAYGAYVDGSLDGRIIVSDDRLRTTIYRRWAQQRPVFVLVDPHGAASVPGTQEAAMLDPYHELLEVTP